MFLSLRQGEMSSLIKKKTKNEEKLKKYFSFDQVKKTVFNFFLAIILEVKGMYLQMKKNKYSVLRSL